MVADTGRFHQKAYVVEHVHALCSFYSSTNGPSLISKSYGNNEFLLFTMFNLLLFKNVENIFETTINLL